MAKDVKKLTTPVFRVAFPSLFEKRAYEDSKDKFGLTGIWDPSKFTEQDKRLWKALLAEMEAAAQTGLKKAWKSLPSNNRGIRDGVEKDGYEGFGEGTRFASMTTLIQPRVFDLNGNDILDPDEVYPGCYARATVNVYSYDNKSKGVAIGLRQVQKIRDGERIDGRSAGSDFDEFADEGWLEEHTDSLLDDPDVDF